MCDQLNEEHDFVYENDVYVCTVCGVEQADYSRVSFHKEWRSFEGNSRYDPNRVKNRKTDDKSIYRDVEGMGFSDNVIALANTIFYAVVRLRIFRGNSRKSLIFASIFHAYKLMGNTQSHDRLITMFKLSKKEGLRGLKYVAMYAPKDIAIRTSYVGVSHLITETMESLNATKNQITDAMNLYEQIKNRSSKINRSRPQSVSSGVVYYWLKRRGINIGLMLEEIKRRQHDPTGFNPSYGLNINLIPNVSEYNTDETAESLRSFSEFVGLSELTIIKICKEMMNILNHSDMVFRISKPTRNKRVSRETSNVLAVAH